MSSRSVKRLALVVVVVIVAGLVLAFVLLRPERVLLAGDSILRQTGPALNDRFGRGVDINNAAVNNSGLLTPGYVDWRERLEKKMKEDDPKVVVFLFIGNYTDTDFYEYQGVEVQRNTPEFFDAWAHEADRLMRVMRDSDADVYWVLPPPQFSPDNQATTDGLRRVYTDLAERWPRIRLIDSYAALAGPSGEYLAAAPGRNGESVPLRSEDTVHLTDAGARRLARVIHDAIQESL